tara:strand:+ start:516 stop:1148 length:633 start_codon:yes stop_codon:yes gene_type:complete
VDNTQRRKEIEDCFRSLNDLIEDALEFRSALWGQHHGVKKYGDPRCGAPTRWNLKSLCPYHGNWPDIELNQDCVDNKYYKVHEEYVNLDREQRVKRSYSVSREVKATYEKIYSASQKITEDEVMKRHLHTKQGELRRWHADYNVMAECFYIAHIAYQKMEKAIDKQEQLCNLYNQHAAHLRQEYVPKDVVKELLVAHGDLDSWELINQSA